MVETELEVKPVAEAPMVAGGRTILAVIWHDKGASIPNASTEASFPFVRVTLGRKAFAAAVLVGMLAAHLFVLACLAYAISTRSGGDRLAIVSHSTALAECFLLAVWMALSPSALWRRGLVVGLISSFGSFPILGTGFWIGPLMVAIISAMLWPARTLAGWRFDFSPERQAALPSVRGGGTLWGMFELTLVWASLLGASRLVFGAGTSDLNFDTFIVLAIWSATVVVYFAAWSVALLGRPSVAAWTMVAVVTGVCFWWAAISFLPSPQGAVLSMGAFATVSGTPLVVGTIWALKCLGWRLYQVRPQRIQKPSDSLDA